MSDIPFIWEVNGQVTPTIVAGNLLIAFGFQHMRTFVARYVTVVKGKDGKGALVDLLKITDDAFSKPFYMGNAGNFIYEGIEAYGFISVLDVLARNMARGQRWPQHVMQLLKNGSFAAGVVAALQLLMKPGSFNPYERGLGSKKWGLITSYMEYEL